MISFATEEKVTYKMISKVIIPMILLSIATHSMMFFDRIMVGKHSLDQMNAMSVASVVSSVVIFALISFASTAETFVGQLNGDKEYKKIASPVWQTIAIILASNVFLLPIAFFTPEFVIEKNALEHGGPYYTILLATGCIPAIHAALSAFFIARGESGIVTLTAILMNVLNILLNFIFIFGVRVNGEWIIEAGGAVGAAIATVISGLLSLIVIFAFFLRKTNRLNFNTHVIKLDFEVMKTILKVGLPSCISHLAEISAWAFIVYLLSAKSYAHITVNNIAQFIFFITHFITAGFEKGLTAISSNLIGAGGFHKIQELVKKSIIFYILMVLPTVIFVIFPKIITSFFEINDAYIIQEISLSLYFIWIYSIIDGINWIYYAVLNSGGDTRFTMTLNIFSVWLCSVLPIYLGLEFFDIKPSMPWLVSLLYSFCILFFARRRYLSQNWLKLDLRENK